jgi:5,10-methylenetetrahydrofolate reductase/methionine synthase I (cobalamin-dependent)
MSALKKTLESNEILIADGAMATTLYERGFYINRSFEELSLTESQAVREAILAFKRTGTQIFHTNTYGASRPKLTEYGLQDQQAEIVTKAAQLSLEVAGDEGFVLGLLGPLGVLVEPLGPTSLEEAEHMFYEVALPLEKAGVHGFAINALHDFNEVECAIRAVRKISNKPIFLNIGLHENLKTSYGHSLHELAFIAEKYDLDVIGMCGEIGPSTMLTAIEQLRPLTRKPIMVLPNAGLPRYVNDQYIYLCNPDYLGKFAKRFVTAGAKVIGGHSGVYDTHIKAISNSIRMAQHSQAETKTGYVPAAIQPVIDKPVEPRKLAERSRLGMALSRGEKIVSVELVPPKLTDFAKFEARCKELEVGGVEFVNIPDGARAMARISSLHLAVHVQKKYKLEAIPHFTCRDRNLIGLQSDLLGAHVGGVRNILLVTGDPPKLGNNPGASAVYDVDAIGLTHIVSRMNRGLDIGGSSTKFCSEYVIGVALNPTAKNTELEIKRFKYKIEAGCDYAITQPIYNVESYKKFMDAAGAPNLPVIMGIWPLVSLRNAEFLKYEVPGVDVPDWIIEEMQKAGDSKEEALKRGMDIAMRTMDEARKIVAGFQVSAPFNRAEVALQVIKAVMK